MSQHLTQNSPEGARDARLAHRVRPGVAEAARQMGVSRQTAGQVAAQEQVRRGLSDRSSRPRRLARATPPDVEDRVCEARSSTSPCSASRPRRACRARTCARIVARSGLPKLADVDRVTGRCRRGPVTRVRYERESPASSCTSTSRRSPAYPTAEAGAPSAGAETPTEGVPRRSSRLHVAVDDFSRVAYAELLPDEKKGACAAFMGRACGSSRNGRAGRARDDDNGPATARASSTRCWSRRASATRTRGPYSPWQNGKVERMNRTLAQEWQYGRAWECEADRAEALPAYIERYNWDRPHSACGGLLPCRASSA